MRNITMNTGNLQIEYNSGYYTVKEKRLSKEGTFYTTQQKSYPDLTSMVEAFSKLGYNKESLASAGFEKYTEYMLTEGKKFGEDLKKAELKKKEK